jgi:zinc/manganese transport system permease protein
MALSVAIALAVVWMALAIAYFSIYPFGFYVTSLGFGAYLLARLARVAAARAAGRRGGAERGRAHADSLPARPA